jgi:hypothetical protein
MGKKFWVMVVVGIAFLLSLPFIVQLILIYFGTSLAEAKSLVEILRSSIETFAIVVAGLWTYSLFVKGRLNHPYPKIQHRIEQFDLGGRW